MATAPGTPHEPAIPPPRFFFAAALVLALFFGVWSWLAFRTETFSAFDKECAQFWHDWTQRHDWPWHSMVYVTGIGGVEAMTVMAVMGAIWQNAINHRFVGIAWLGIMLGVAVLNQTTKDAFDRDRPDPSLRDRAVLEENKSYPSGHSMASAVGYGMLAYALILPQRRRPRRIVTLIVLSCLILAIGFTRIYLRAHWFSDVLGRWALGLTWLFFCLGCLELRRRRLHAARPLAA
jgi:membrane-associated phospholipid phosphatase